MSIYTIVLDFDGGTSVAQVQAEFPVAAVRAWCAQIDRTRELGSKSASLSAAVLENLDAHELAELAGLRGVWCFTALLGNRLVLGHVIHSADA